MSGETYFGKNLSDEAAEILFISKFNEGELKFKKACKKELRLFQTKWFDYRILHPVVATYLYAHEFTKVYRRYYSSTRDCEVGKYVKGYKGRDIWLIKDMMGFVRGRQQADSMGIPYWFYIESAYDILFIKKWKHIPRHCHLYSPYVIENIQLRWEVYSKESLVLAKCKFFLNPENIDRPAFVAHQQWLLDRLEHSKIKKLAMADLIERGYLISPVK